MVEHADKIGRELDANAKRRPDRISSLAFPPQVCFDNGEAVNSFYFKRSAKTGDDFDDIWPSSNSGLVTDKNDKK